MPEVTAWAALKTSAFLTYQAWDSPQWGQRTEALTGAWKVDPQRHV
jgi:hypothetical protein